MCNFLIPPNNLRICQLDCYFAINKTVEATLQNHISLKPYNTFGFEVFAENYMAIHSIEELKNCIAQYPALPKKILGGGSNIIFSQDVSALLIHNQIKGKSIISESGDNILVAFGGGEIWHDAVLFTLENNWGGMENLSLIPGTMGAAPIQNIGAYGTELKDVFHSLKAVHLTTGEIHEFDSEACRFGYRESIFKHEFKDQFCIVEVVVSLSKNPQIKTQYGDIQQTLESWGIEKPSIQDVSKAVIHIRSSKLPNPKETGNCGSFFKNPVVPTAVFEAIQQKYPHAKSYPVSNTEVKVPAGWLIETAGWKGYTQGNIGVHAKQALVLVNYGGGNGAEIIALAQKIQSDILAKFNIALEMEVNRW